MGSSRPDWWLVRGLHHRGEAQAHEIRRRSPRLASHLTADHAIPPRAANAEAHSGPTGPVQPDQAMRHLAGMPVADGTDAAEEVEANAAPGRTRQGGGKAGPPRAYLPHAQPRP